MNAKKTVEDLKVTGQRVLVRCDFNVPLKDGILESGGIAIIRKER